VRWQDREGTVVLEKGIMQVTTRFSPPYDEHDTTRYEAARCGGAWLSNLPRQVTNVLFFLHDFRLQLLLVPKYR
jgi:hypothetical protein